MAGLGRRTHYRKHLTDKVLHDFPEPTGNESIAKVVATRGGNQFDIILPLDNSPQLAMLPTKFRKLVWLKRNDFVIVQTGGGVTDDATHDTGGIRYIINHILYKEQVKHLRQKGLWPNDDSNFAEGNLDEIDLAATRKTDEGGIVYEYDDCSDEDNVDADLFVNTNRVAAMTVQDSSDSEVDES